MNRLVTAAVVLGALMGSARAAAQVPFGPRVGAAAAPPFSPYLNLTRPGGSPALNYYGLVRPELQTRNAVLGLQQQVTANRTLLTNLTNQNDPTGGAGLPDTGHTATFLNTGTYFMNLNPAARPVTPQAGRQPPTSAARRR